MCLLKNSLHTKDGQVLFYFEYKHYRQQVHNFYNDAISKKKET